MAGKAMLAQRHQERHVESPPGKDILPLPYDVRYGRRPV